MTKDHDTGADEVGDNFHNQSQCPCIFHSSEGPFVLRFFFFIIILKFFYNCNIVESLINREEV